MHAKDNADRLCSTPRRPGTGFRSRAPSRPTASPACSRPPASNRQAPANPKKAKPREKAKERVIAAAAAAGKKAMLGRRATPAAPRAGSRQMARTPAAPPPTARPSGRRPRRDRTRRHGPDRIGAHGVSGEVGLQLFTEPLIAMPPGRVDDGRRSPIVLEIPAAPDNGIVARVEGITDRDAAEALGGTSTCFSTSRSCRKRGRGGFLSRRPHRPGGGSRRAGRHGLRRAEISAPAPLSRSH